MRIAALQTRYAGCHFRSRLEARWAVFFDALGVRWEYEGQGIQVNGTPYLPDFYLRDINLFFEVKGDANLCPEDHGVPGFRVGDESYNIVVAAGDMRSHYLHAAGQGPGGWPEDPCYVKPANDDTYEWCRCDWCGLWHLEYLGAYGNERCPRSHPRAANRRYLRSSDWQTRKDAFMRASQARFEHGERP